MMYVKHFRMTMYTDIGAALNVNMMDGKKQKVKEVVYMFSSKITDRYPKDKVS